MSKIKYYYDTDTCKYERVKTTTGDIALNILLIFLLTLTMAFGIFLLLDKYLESPRELFLSNEVKELQYYYNNLDEEVKALHHIISEIEHRDNNIYRTILGIEPFKKAGPNKKINRYKNIRNKNMANEDVIVGLNKDVDELKYTIYAELKSQEEIAELAKNKEDLLAAIPAIQPISNQHLYALSSGFGLRVHPIYKVKKMHKGIDFSAPIGTPVYATADGVVKRVSVSFGGYGKMLEIDHGFGYYTRYAHLHGFAVKRWQHVKRGELIGYLGNTGMSTAPHLHYEVLINKKQVNPVHYFFDDLNPAEYEKIIELASIENQSLGM